VADWSAHLGMRRRMDFSVADEVSVLLAMEIAAAFSREKQVVSQPLYGDRCAVRNNFHFFAISLTRQEKLCRTVLPGQSPDGFVPRPSKCESVWANGAPGSEERWIVES
jgi:hypothetical protein